MTAPAPPPRKPDKPGEPDKDARARSRAALSSLPRVDRVAAHPSLASARRRLGAQALTQMARLAVDAARSKVLAGEPCPSLDEVAALVDAQARASLGARARPVINATGVILHTNLGRAPLSQAAVDALARSAGHYTSIEMDVATGKRGARGAFAEEALARLSGAEAALVVNNNAAAVMLALSALAHGRKVLVSRGELVEIGGGFRVPDVLARSGAEIVAGGTTNKPRLDDYARELGRGIALVLSVRRATSVRSASSSSARAPCSCASRTGTAPSPSTTSAAARSSTCRPTRLRGRPSVQESVRAGFDLVCFQHRPRRSAGRRGALASTAPPSSARAGTRSRAAPPPRPAPARRAGGDPRELPRGRSRRAPSPPSARPSTACARAPPPGSPTSPRAAPRSTASTSPISRSPSAAAAPSRRRSPPRASPSPPRSRRPRPRAPHRRHACIRSYSYQKVLDARTVLPGEDAARLLVSPSPARSPPRPQAAPPRARREPPLLSRHLAVDATARSHRPPPSTRAAARGTYATPEQRPPSDAAAP
ncbi:MAG: hypothetical protein R3F14_42505 [Polyangiaceae bacterium]